MELFNYRPEGKDFGDKKLMIIKKMPIGIIGRVKGYGRIIIWDKEVADDHIDDTEKDLLSKAKTIIDKL